VAEPSPCGGCNASFDPMNVSQQQDGFTENAPPPIDLPGALLVPGFGCYEIFLALDSQLYGPFGLKV
jgi:hypothetical protein